MYLFLLTWFRIFVVNCLLIFCLSPSFHSTSFILVRVGLTLFTHDCLSLMKFFEWIILGLMMLKCQRSVFDSGLVLKTILSVIVPSYYLVIGVHFQWLHFICFSGQLGKCVCGLGEAAWMPGKMPCNGWRRVSQLFAF